MIIRNLYSYLINFNKYNIEMIILELLAKKIKNIAKLNIFNLKHIKIIFKRLINYKNWIFSIF